MGSKYSINGFINAALRRSGKTLLVEGISDRNVILRLHAERDCDAVFTVDQAGILEGECCAGMGNKEKVKEVVRVAQQLANNLPRINDVLAVLKDREWDGLPPGEFRLSNAWVAPVQGAREFSTQGHSIENYNFRRDHVVAYLKMAFSGSLKNGFFSLINDEFKKILVVSSCLSLALQEEGVLSRVGGLLRHEHFEPNSDRVVIATSLISSLESRGCAEPRAKMIVDRINGLVENHEDSLSTNISIQWLPHGHAGEECIWACIGAYARLSGVDSVVCNSIVSFGRDERQRYMATLLAKTVPEDIFPLPEIVEWLAA
ncbi:hypothetical protein N5D45_11455 [Stenotrophomonas sp. GD03819]|uniref:hypothetical protein n=1 Tax=Stenotrophomonas TaxID=40323 RepID=UPI0011B64E96|nr:MULTISPECIES: hypothetical protein [unclassified Stenotrophomonas]MCU1060808.1 hypothetical protein [Stenotrophomonas maltophilia]MDH1244828.1 hypothetical protein [Stenotrophomonas sp. GD03948]MDH1579796.1 hypothetical protein [Stenotrophomonas sp. GD03744]MDH1792436.1 hypothetical protein [Stenotrophomonas sp. GD03819]MDJ1524277.1 hypothetical protein [Stenotrophomonas maltophilia]